MSQSRETQTVPTALLSGCGTFSWNVQTNVFQVDATLACFLDLTDEEQMFGISIERYLKNVHADDLVRVRDHVNHSMRTGEPCRQAYRLVSEKNGAVSIIAMGQCFRDRAGKPSDYAGMILDADKFNAHQEQQGMIDNCIATRDSARNLNEDLVAYLMEMALQHMGYSETEPARRR